MDNRSVRLKQKHSDRFFTRLKVKSSLLDRINRANVRTKKKTSKIISHSENMTIENCVQLNSFISVKTSFGIKHYLKIVLPEDADIKCNKLSVFSSLGSAVYGKKKGDLVKWSFLGKIEYAQILKVSSPNYESSNFIITT